MPLFTEQQLLERFEREQRKRTTNARTILFEGTSIYSDKTYDIFLSHNSLDEEKIAGLKLQLEDLDYSVYVDWKDEFLNPNIVTPQTAAILRNRMRKCRSFIYAYSKNSTLSKWMPWELGYYDAFSNSKIAVLPISKVTEYTYEGQEYLGLYNYIQFDRVLRTSKNAIWVYNSNKYAEYRQWMSGIKTL